MTREELMEQAGTPQRPHHRPMFEVSGIDCRLHHRGMGAGNAEPLPSLR